MLLGRGFQYRHNSFLNLSLGLAYYLPKLSMRPPAREGLWLEINQIYPGGAFTFKEAFIDYPKDIYNYELHEGIGAHLRIDAKYPITKNLSFRLGLGYRYLNLEEYYARDHLATSWKVEFIRNRDFSGGTASVGVNIEF